MNGRKDTIPVQAELGPQESFTELLVELAGKSAVLVREEVSLARQEIKENFRDLKTSLVMLGVGFSIAAFAAFSLVDALILGLSKYMEPWQAALAVGLGMALLALIIIFAALHQLKQARIKPEQTLVTLEENKEWLKEIT